MDVYNPPEGGMSPILIDNSLFSTCLWIQNVNCLIIFILFTIQNRNYIKWQIEQQKNFTRLKSNDDSSIKIIASHTKKVAKNLPWWTHIIIFLSYWVQNAAVSHMWIYIIILLLAQYIHELFVTLLLLDMFYIFPDTQNVFKAFWDPRKKLITALFLWLIFLYLFSILAYLTLQSLYQPICYNLVTCVSVLFREIFRTGRIGGLYATLENYLDPKSDMNTGPNGEFFVTWGGAFDYLQFLFLVGCLFNWTFTSLIVESYGKLRAVSIYQINDIENICMACGFSREEITKKCEHGYDKHVQNEHNQWNYLIYMATLYAKNDEYNNGDENEQFSGTEKYVFDKIKQKEIHWFPMNRSNHFN